MSLDATTYNHMAHRHSRNVALQKVWYRNFCVVKIFGHYAVFKANL